MSQPIPTPTSKQAIRHAIGEGRLAEAATQALAYAEHCRLPDIANALTALNARLHDHQDKWDGNLLSYEEYARTHAQLTHGLLAWIDRLPDTLTPAGPRRRFVTEDDFKKRVFVLLLLIKVGVFLWLWYLWATGGFTAEQFQITSSLLLPTLAAYVSVVLGSYLREAQRSQPTPPRYLSGVLVGFAYWLFPIYAVALAALLVMKVKGTLSFGQMSFWLAMTESVLGGYIGQILNGLFRQEKGD